MDIKEIQLKEIGELQHLLTEARKKLDELMFKTRQKQLKNIREIREIKKDIARILTVLKTKNQ